MSQTVAELYAAALALPREERAELVEMLEESFEREPGRLHPEWDAELRRRTDEIDSGKVRAIPLEQVDREVDELLAELEAEHAER